MKKHIMLILFAFSLFTATQVHAQQVDSAAMARSQQRIENDLKGADKMQGKIDKRQKRIEKQQKRIARQERKREKQERKKEKRMNKIEKEQRKLSDATNQ